VNNSKNIVLFGRPALLAALMGLTACAPVTGTNNEEVSNKEASNAAPTVAVDGDVPDAALDAIASMLPRQGTELLEMDLGRPSSIPGFYEVIVNGNFFLVSADGRYVIRGDVFDRVAQVDIADKAMSNVRKRLLDEQAPFEERIVFAPKNTKHTVTVFTDISCGYCRRLHSQIEDYNARGIAIEYLAFNRMGPDSENDLEMQSVWCAKDRRQAITAAKNGESVEHRVCDNPVEKHHALGVRLGLQGTPMMITETGEAIHGYLPPDMLEQRLEALSVQDLAPINQDTRTCPAEDSLGFV